MCRIISGTEINKKDWIDLIEVSPVATWFQTQEAFEFLNSLSFLEAFALGVEDDGKLKGVAVGWIQKDGGKLKRFFSRRAIINGGPLLAEDIRDEELKALLKSTKNRLKGKAIYIEIRNFNNYSRWKSIFEQNGFNYEPHLNFHLDTTSLEKAQANLGNHRKKYIRLSLRDGAYLVENPSIEQIRSFYGILDNLYKTKVKTPLFPFEFFEKLYQSKVGHFFLIGIEDNIVGGSVCVGLKSIAIYEWFVCGNEHFRKNIRPSSLATWLGIEYAAQNGYPRFDFMGAGKPSEEYGVRNFKAEFGGKLVEFGRYKHICSHFLYWIGTIGVVLLKKSWGK